VASPPTGIVTFLFTDIEGSTKLWERDAEAMQGALARHDAILHSVTREHDGYVFKTVGDAFCCAFSTAAEAFEAALEAQRALLTEEGWPEQTGPLRVRMALHAGAAEERDGDYFGPPVNRVARLLSAGHGAQVLLSLAARELVRDRLPPGVKLRDLGEHRLKDLFGPERVFQLMVPSLPAEFPPLRTLEGRPNNLPLQPTPLVGRESEVEEVAERLGGDEVRLLTLTGPGGTGKTRLALQVGADLLEEFDDGVFFVSLATITHPELVPSTIAGSLRLRESVGQSLTETLEGYLHHKRLLLILDNFEQVLEGTPVVGELLGGCPNLKVLATSRIPLRLYGEQEYPVPPLEVPDPLRLPPLGRLVQYEAVRLFVERAKAVKPDFEITNNNASAVAEICVRLDGLPLAIELAAARTKLLPPRELLSRLGNRLRILKGGARNLPARQQTLRATIDWSYDLLDEGEKTLFRRLSVFSGGSTLEAIEEICDPQGELEALEVVGSLLEKSLLRREEGADGGSRFAMLETVREYAREKLEESGEAEETRRRHAEHYLALAETAELELLGAGQGRWMRRLRTEFANLREAHAWSLKPDEDSRESAEELRLRLAGALWRFWQMEGMKEGRRWLETTLERDSRGFPAVRAKALSGLGFILIFQQDYERAIAVLEEAVALYRGLGDSSGAAFALGNLGYAVLHGDYRERVPAFVWEAEALMQADLDGHARTFLRIIVASAAIGQGDLDAAVPQLEESLALSRELGDRRSVSMALFTLGMTELRRGNLERGAKLLEEGARITRELGDRLGAAYFALALGKLSVLRGSPVRAARLWGAAEALREQIGISLSKFDLAASGYEQDLARVRSALEEATFEAAWAEGHAMSFAQAVGYLLGEPATSGEEEGTLSPAIGTAVRPEEVTPDAEEGAAEPR
jgi:predicted ATPase/class 3 adenylate cyclase